MFLNYSDSLKLSGPLQRDVLTNKQDDRLRSLVNIMTNLWTERSWNRGLISGGVGCFCSYQSIQTGPGALPPSCTICTGCISRGKVAGAWS